VDPLVTVITPTTGNPLLEAVLESVARQTYQPIQHLVIIDGSERSPAARRLISTRSIDVIELPIQPDSTVSRVIASTVLRPT
jgi:hypothetical protein